MSEYLTDQERVELLKKWWSDYGVAIIIGLVLGIAIMYGTQYWQSQKMKQHEQASNSYQALLMMSDKNLEAYKTQGQMIVKDFPKTPYASLANFLLAKEAVNEQKYEEAIKNFDWVLKYSNNASFKQMARIQSARIYLNEHQYKEAQTRLATVDDKNYDVLINDLRGDIFLAEGNIEEARKAYQEALKNNAKATELLPLLTIKLNSLPLTNA